MEDLAPPTTRPDVWLEYLKVTATAAPHATLMTALDNFEKDGFPAGMAVDLGCGQGRDTKELLRRQWTVLAIDSSQTALDELKKNIDAEFRDAEIERINERAALQTLNADFENLRIPGTDFVNASFSIPFCRPDRFPAFWRQVLIGLRSGGRFAGHFFGPNDEWVLRGSWTHFSRPRLLNVFYGFEMELFYEDERNFPTSEGIDKHWHLFHVVAKKL